MIVIRNGSRLAFYAHRPFQPKNDRKVKELLESYVWRLYHEEAIERHARKAVRKIVHRWRFNLFFRTSPLSIFNATHPFNCAVNFPHWNRAIKSESKIFLLVQLRALESLQFTVSVRFPVRSVGNH